MSDRLPRLKKEATTTYHSVHSCHLLPDHQRDRNERAFAVRWDEPHLLEECLRRCVADQPPFVLELLCHVIDFVLYVLVVRREASRDDDISVIG